MAILTKDQLTASNSASFPDNTTGAITPTILRNFNQSVIDTLVDSLDTGSFVTSAITGSSLITASFSGQTLTFTKGNGTQFGVTISTASGSVPTDISALNAFTQSQDTKDSTLATYTGSVDTKFNTIGTQSGSWDNTNLNSFTQSQETKNSTLATYTASVDTKFSTIGTQSGSWDNTALNAFTSSQNTKDSTLATYTASVDTKFSNIGSQSGSWDNTNLNSFTQSQDTKNSTLATYTGSNDTKWSNLGSQSGSFVTESETGSFARTDVSNTFSATQTINADLIVSGTINAYKINTTIESSSVIYSSGSNQFGDASDDVQTLYGSVRVMNQLTASGLNYPTADGTVDQVIITDGAGNLSFTTNAVTAISEDVRYGEDITLGDPLYVNGSNGNRPIVFKADASDPAKMPVIYVASTAGGVNTNTKAITLGLITGVTTTGYPAGTDIYVAEGGGWSSSRPSGSVSIVQSLGIVTKEGSGGSGRGLVLNPGPATLPNLESGYAWVGNSGNQPVAVLTSSFAENTDLSSLNTFTASVDTKFSTLGGQTGSFATTGSNNFRGVETIGDIVGVGTGEVYLLGRSGSLVLGATGLTPLYSALAHLSSSQVNTNVNLIFKTNLNTPDTIISGANNIFVNPAAPTTNFKRYFGGSGNIVLGTTAPQITGSMGFSPTMNNNYWGGSGASPFMRGPASSSAWTISNNIANNNSAYNIGTSATNNAQQIVSGLTISNNIGNVAPAIQAYKTPLSASVVFSTNSGTGQISMNCDSSSIQISNTTFNGGTTINNSYFPATVNSNASIQVATSNVFGTNIINASGSDTTFTGVQPRGVYNSVVGGYSTIGLVLNGDNAAVNSSVIIGGGLIVTGSNSKVAGATANTDFGSAFFGRWNDINGTRDLSAETVFAVGTGTSTSLRKTGFLIDSGSNTFVEGTLNVSGGVFQNVVPVTIASSTASLDLRAGTYFTLTLADNTTTHINTTNLAAGVSATLVITTGTNSSASLSPTLLQPSGSAYSATNGSTKVDILSLVSTDASNMYVVSTKNMI